MGKLMGPTESSEEKYGSLGNVNNQMGHPKKGKYSQMDGTEGVCFKKFGGKKPK